jgi:hypothetical protein
MCFRFFHCTYRTNPGGDLSVEIASFYRKMPWLRVNAGGAIPPVKGCVVSLQVDMKLRE